MPISWMPESAPNIAALLIQRYAQDREANFRSQQLGQQAQEADLNRAQRASEFAQSRQPSQRDAWEAGVQRQNMVMQAGIHDQLNANQLTRAEEMRLQRMQNTLDALDNDPNLEEQDKADARTELLTGVNRLQMQQQRAQAQQHQTALQMQEQAVQRQNALNTAMRNGDLSGLQTAEGEDGTRFYMGPNGQLQPVPGQEGKLTPQQLGQIWHQATQHADRSIAAAARPGGPALPTITGENGQQVAMNHAQITQDYYDNVVRMVGGRRTRRQRPGGLTPQQIANAAQGFQAQMQPPAPAARPAAPAAPPPPRWTAPPAPPAPSSGGMLGDVVGGYIGSLGGLFPGGD